MTDLLWVLAAGGALITWIAVALTSVLGARRLRRLEDVGRPRPEDPPLPRVSVIVTAHNEERSAERALRSLLAQDYADYEVVYVDDRSDDRTGEIADRLSREDARVKVIHVRALPAGWFGKNHAAWRAASAATGDVLLFTDGDAIFAPGAVEYGVRHLVREKLDFLSVFGRVAVRGALLQACVMNTTLALFSKTRPWEVRDPESPASFGFGPYIMFRAAAYRTMGGYRRIALRPDEDVQICKLAKRSGLPSDVLVGHEHVQFEWYTAPGGLVRGLEKSFFATLDYRLSQVVSGTLALFWLLSPFVLAPAAAAAEMPVALALAAVAVGVCWTTVVLAARAMRYPGWTGLLYPLATLIVSYIMWRSTLVTMTRGVAWGGPPVPLSELRAHARPGGGPAGPSE